MLGERMAKKPDVTKKFGEKRSAIVHAASVLINDTGVQATTLTKVARAIGLNATSVTYYFPRKDQLIVSVYAETIALLKSMAQEALVEDSLEKRIARYVHLHVALRERIRRGERGLMTALSEIRSLDQDQQDELLFAYREMVNEVRAFFGEPADETQRALFSARAHILIEAMLWWPVWSRRYSVLDFARVETKIVDILCFGIPATRGEWDPLPLEDDGWRTHENAQPQQNDEFLRAATVMINERGYRGASVNRIAEALNVTKGSFYHHHDAKDDLVLECFQRSYDRLSKVQMAGRDVEGSYWTRRASSTSCSNCSSSIPCHCCAPPRCRRSTASTRRTWSCGPTASRGVSPASLSTGGAMDRCARSIRWWPARSSCRR